MPGLKLNHVSKRGHRQQAITWHNVDSLRPKTHICVSKLTIIFPWCNMLSMHYVMLVSDLTYNTPLITDLDMIYYLETVHMIYMYSGPSLKTYSSHHIIVFTNLVYFAPYEGLHPIQDHPKLVFKRFHCSSTDKKNNQLTVLQFIHNCIVSIKYTVTTGNDVTQLLKREKEYIYLALLYNDKRMKAKSQVTIILLIVIVTRGILHEASKQWNI